MFQKGGGKGPFSSNPQVSEELQGVKIRIACFAHLPLEYPHISKQTLLEFISSYGVVQNSFNKHSLSGGNESVFVTNDVCIILTLLILGICRGAASNHLSTTAYLPCMLIRWTLFPLDVRNTVRYTRGHAQRISVTVWFLEKPLAIPVTFTYTGKGVGGTPLALFSSNLHLFMW